MIGVFERNESFAASLGAKLHGPRLLKGFEKFFEGPIKTRPTQSPTQPITWLDVCTFAKTNPDDFVLTTSTDGSRCCQFLCKGQQVEISEDDWRFISSGALNRIPLEHPLEEDETAELATLDILEQRVSILWRGADAVAARSRILHHKLGQRRQEILRRRNSQEETSPSGSRFQSVNQPPRTPSQGSYDLHTDLMQQFLSASTPVAAPRSTSAAGLSQGRASPSVASQQHRLSTSGRPAGTTESDAQADTFRPVITQKIDKLFRGDLINPPCDRCRRLKLQCVKHLTACQGCTKKHAKCSWKAITDEEAAKLKQDMGIDVGAGSEVDTEMQTPEPRSLEASRGPVTSPEGSRPASQSGGDTSGPGMVGSHGVLPLPGERIELPPMRMRMSLPQGQGPGGAYGGGGARAGTPQSQSSASQFGGEGHNYGPSNPPSR